MRIQQTVAGGAPALDALARGLVVIGSELMDLYTGPLTPRQIGEQVLAWLQAEDRLEWPAFQAWIKAGGGYQVVTLPSGPCRWVLRLGDESGCYVHVHPGRWSPETCRVRANVLKTAVMVLAHVGVHGGDLLDRQRVNEVRQRYLSLAPIGRDLSNDAGIGEIVRVLQG